MLLRKNQGGCTMNYGGRPYTWEHDGDAVEVPYEFAVELLAISGGDYSVPEELPDVGQSDSGTACDPVTEPAPEGANPVTEPAPGNRGGRRRTTKVTE